MLHIETSSVNGREMTRTYSDAFMIRKVGTDEIYSEAYDVTPYAYEETDTPLPEEPDTEADMVKALRTEVSAVKAERDALTVKPEPTIEERLAAVETATLDLIL